MNKTTETLENIIERCANLAKDHYDMDYGSILGELEELDEDVAVAEEDFVKAEELLESAILAVRAVRDVGEYHSGGSVTQF